MDVQDQFYLTLFSTASQKVYPGNKHNAYTIDLAQPIELGGKNDRWEVGVCEFRYPQENFGETMFGMIYVDIISPQYVGDQLVRCIRTFLEPKASGTHSVFDTVYYMPVQQNRFRTITVEVMTLEGKPFVMADSEVPSQLVLHFRRVPI